jgi:hypothetical protein
MTADLARISYDPTRQYRSVISQQGRVTLEADGNEAATIASEELRLETIDLIGPTGTPDDGFKVGPGNGSTGVGIGPGVFYLGGWRLELDAAIDDLSTQPDWLDRPESGGEGNFVIALLLNEQSVCAVEDHALREVALGGPDSAARARLMRHFLRLAVDGTDCAAGLGAVETLLAADGLSIDPATLQLLSTAQLQVGFVPGQSTDSCSPAAAGGYLGADNQLIRVTVTAYAPASQTGTLLWGWNNASLLYRAKATDPLTLTISNTPVDEEHAPQLGQAVEILRSQAHLGHDNFIADPQGFVTTLAQAYSFDTGAIALTDALPAEYTADKTPLFVRLWQAVVPFTAGQATALDNVSGVTVTVTLPALPSNIGLRPFWRFAVRPSTPVRVYPRRYLDKPQPPDGPRQWVTDLGVVEAGGDGQSKLLADCRVPFLPLTKLGGSCCSLVLGPNDVAGRGGLQAVMDSVAGSKSSVSLLPGDYPLSAPLVLGPQHAGLTLQGCGPNAILTAAATDLRPFIFGLVIVEQTAGITLRQLTFLMPNVVLGAGDANVQPDFSIGLLVGMASALTVEACAFFTNPKSAYSFGAGLLALGDCAGLVARRNMFAASQYEAGSMIFGILATVLSANVTTSLGDAEICDNLFERLPGAVVAYAQLGVVRCSGNRVVGCGTGLYFAASNLAATGQVAQIAATQSVQQAQYADLSRTINQTLQAPLLANIVTNAAAFAPRVPAPASTIVSSIARNVLVGDITTRGASSWDTLSRYVGDAANAAPAAAQTGAAQTGATVDAAPAAAVGSVDQTMQAALNTVRDVSIDAEINGYTQTPVLHISGNDITLVGTQTTPGIGIGVVFSPNDEEGTVLLTANRVTTADTRTMAAGLLYPSAAAVTGNVLLQIGERAESSVAALGVVAEKNAELEVTANIVHFRTTLFPPRANSSGTTTWDFLNTVG